MHHNVHSSKRNLKVTFYNWRVLEERGNTDTEFTLFYAFERQIHQLFAATKRQAKVTEFVGWIP
jgi:hypothetical protein